MASRSQKLRPHSRVAAKLAASATLATAGVLATVVAVATVALPPLHRRLGSCSRMTLCIASDSFLQDVPRASLLHASTVAPGHKRTRVHLHADGPHESSTPLTVGQRLQAHVSRCGETGAHLDLENGQQGFLHISKMTRDYAEMAQRMVLLGREITVWIQDIRSTGKVMLTCREPGKMADLVEGQELQGKVMGFLPNGAFVDVGVDRDGFVHKSKISYNYVEKPNALLEIGQKITVWVRKILPDGKLELTCLRPVDLSGFVGVSENMWLPGTVEDMNWYSMRILVEPPSMGPPQLGLVTKEELSDSGNVKPSRIASVGDYVRVRVIKVDVNKGFLHLSLRA